MLIPKKRTGYSRVTHPFATLTKKCKHPLDPVRLACVKHAASVHPEPGSNSPTKTKNIGSSQKTIQQKQTPTIKKQNVPKSSASKKQKTRKNQNTQPNSQAPQLNPTQTKQKNTLSRTQTTKPQTNQKRSVKVAARKTRESQSNRFGFWISTYF